MQGWSRGAVAFHCRSSEIVTGLDGFFKQLRDPALAPSGHPACMDMAPRQLSSNGFSPGMGFTGGFSAGYAFGGPRTEPRRSRER